MAILSCHAVPALNMLPVDHTFVTSDDGFAWGCFGNDSGGKPLRSANGNSKCANCLSYPQIIALVPQLYSGLRYGKTGLCHQAANRILFFTGIDVVGSVGYQWSVARYFTFGIGPWPELANCATIIAQASQNPTLQPRGGSGMKRDAQFSASIQNSYSPETFRKLDSQDERLKIKRKELELMAVAYLGEGYDRAKVRDVIEIQLNTDIEQDNLLGKLDDKNLTEEAYANELERLFAHSADACERVLGSQDFEKMFGIRAKDAPRLVDRAHLLAR
jgi:hypothetical protein